MYSFVYILSKTCSHWQPLRACVRVQCRHVWRSYICGGQKTTLGQPSTLFQAGSHSYFSTAHTSLAGSRTSRDSLVSSSHVPKGELGNPDVPDMSVQSLCEFWGLEPQSSCLCRQVFLHPHNTSQAQKHFQPFLKNVHQLVHY